MGERTRFAKKDQTCFRPRIGRGRADSEQTVKTKAERKRIFKLTLN